MLGFVEVTKRAHPAHPTQGTLAGWSGDVVPPAERKRLVTRLDGLNRRIRSTLDEDPASERQ